METLTTDAATSDAIPWTGGKGTAPAQGTFGGGAFHLEASFDAEATWIALADESGTTVTLTADGIISFEIAACQLRAVLAGSAGATVEFTIRPIP